MIINIKKSTDKCLSKLILILENCFKWVFKNYQNNTDNVLIFFFRHNGCFLFLVKKMRHHNHLKLLKRRFCLSINIQRNCWIYEWILWLLKGVYLNFNSLCSEFFLLDLNLKRWNNSNKFKTIKLFIMNYNEGNRIKNGEKRAFSYR